MQDGDVCRVEGVPREHGRQSLKEPWVQPHPPEVQGHVGDLVVTGLCLGLHLTLQPSPKVLLPPSSSPRGPEGLENGLRVQICLLAVADEMRELLQVSFHLQDIRRGEMEEGVLEEAGEDLGLV